MLETFEITRDTKFIIYGTGCQSIDIYHHLKMWGGKIYAFFDQRAKEIQTIDNIPVYELKDNCWKSALSGIHEYVVIIGLMNGQLHSRIADKLFMEGFYKIIYLPMPDSIVGRAPVANKLRIAYRSIRDGEFDFKALQGLPFFQLEKELINTRNNILVRTKHYLTTFVPVELLFSEGKTVCEHIFNSPILKLDSWDYRMSSFKKIEQCYRRHEFDWGFINSKTFLEYVNDRKRLEETFLNALNYGMDFFIQSAPNADISSNGYFLIKDGNHRAAFLISKGLKRIPIRIRKEDYLYWMNWKAIHELKRQYGLSKIKPLLVFHPFFDEKSNLYHGMNNLFGKWVSSMFLQFDVPRLKLLFFSISLPYEGIPLAYGGNSVIWLVREKERYNVENLLRIYRLYNDKCICIFSERLSTVSCGEYDCLWLDYEAYCVYTQIYANRKITKYVIITKVPFSRKDEIKLSVIFKIWNFYQDGGMYINIFGSL